MSLEIIESIKKAETQGDETVKKAEQEARDIVSNAQARSHIATEKAAQEMSAEGGKINRKGRNHRQKKG